MKGIFGVVGHPIIHSLSPVMHNAVFNTLKLDYSYRPFDVKKEELADFINEAEENNIRGLNITIPHKVDVMTHLDRISNEAKLIGAVNTINVGRELVGYNTDGVGCVKALEEAGADLKGSEIIVLGSGGAARAIVFQCVMCGADVYVANRTRERALKLAGDVEEKLGFTIDLIDFDNENLKEFAEGADILINATSVGMSPNDEESPIDASILHNKLSVMDIVYNPIETQLLRDARKAGCKTIDGVGMLVHQGAESLRIWLNVEPPIGVMRDAVVERLTLNKH